MARLNLARTVVVAPYAGSIAERLADEGTTALAQPQTIVVILQETGLLEAHAAIPENQMALVQPGDPASVSIEGLAAPIASAVSAVSDTIDPATRTYLVKIPVPNPDRAIKAGVFAHVEIEPALRREALIAPRETIRFEDGRARLIAVRAGRVELVPIEIGATSGSEVEVISGANDGDLAIVGEGARTIAPGIRVSTAQSEAPETQGPR
jgi:RND family efflux transporter MFP subunit